MQIAKAFLEAGAVPITRQHLNFLLRGLSYLDTKKYRRMETFSARPLQKVRVDQCRCFRTA